MIAALFVERGGPYFGLPNVDPWDEKRDARKYAGPWPVVAHPPCARWCAGLSGLVEAVYGYRKGDDDGCFASALASVRTWGGVLEHPAYSQAWRAFDLQRPPPSGGWVRDLFGGWTCHVEQGKWGHPAAKATWLYGFRIHPPSMPWGRTPEELITAKVSYLSNHGGVPRKRLRSKAASSTPTSFRDLLISIAESARGVAHA